MELLQNSTLFRSLCHNSGPADLQYDNSSELFRIATYAKFPTTTTVTERSLARAGFYYTGVNDRVQCFCCNVTAENWQSGDCPAERHKLLSPNCSFIQSLPGTANLCNVVVLQLSASATTGATTTVASAAGQTEEQVDLNMGFSNLALSSPLSSRGVEDMSQQRPPACHNPGMRREQKRLDTFQNWTLSTITPVELAKAGFYYLGQGDRVACFCCGGQFSNWEPGDRAVSEHQRHYPNCSFVRGDRADNIPLSGHGLSNVSNPAMQQCDERLLTFVSCPLIIPVQPEKLAKAGFYYVGCNDDVKCFCCDGGLRCWESGDDPWVEHAKWFPRCEYLLQEKGQEFVHQIQAEFTSLFEQLLTSGDSNSREFVDPPVVHLGNGEQCSEDAVMMNNPVVKSALEMGFERGLVKQTVRSKILTSGENYKTVQELVSDLISAEDEKREEERELLAEEMASAQTNEAALPSQDLSDLPMKEQLRRLQQERTCKVCMDKEVNIVFIPCGHLVVCKECAPSLRKCPICRGLVKGNVLTFLS